MRIISSDVSIEGTVRKMIGGRSVEVDWLIFLSLEIWTHIVVLVKVRIVNKGIRKRINGSYWLFVRNILDCRHVNFRN